MSPDTKRSVSLPEEGNLDTEAWKEDGHVRMEAETGGHCHQPTNAWGSQKLEEAAGSLLRDVGGSMALQHLGFGLLPPQLGENKFPLFQSA